MRNKGYRLGMRPMRFMLGYKRLRVARAHLERTLEICISNEITYWDAEADGERGELCVLFFSAPRLLKLLSERGISAEECASGGIPALTIKHRRRLGIPIGLVLGAILIFTSGLFVWDIRVDGEEKLTEEQVEEALSYCGLSVGTRIGSLDIDVIENRVLILSDDISWISVNMRGTVANVEIRELDIAPDGGEEPEASNIVADSAGVIERFEDIHGRVVADIGEAVSEGQLLISGIYGDDLTGIGYTAAEGKVFAECEDSIRVEIPRKYQKKVYTGEVRCEKYLIFFKKEIKFFSNYRNSYATCDKIDIVEYLSAPGGDELPVGIRTVKYLEYTYEETERSDTELTDTARYRADAILTSRLCDGELLRKSVSVEVSDSGCVLICRYRCLRNIAKSKPIEVIP